MNGHLCMASLHLLPLSLIICLNNWTTVVSSYSGIKKRNGQGHAIFSLGAKEGKLTIVFSFEECSFTLFRFKERLKCFTDCLAKKGVLTFALVWNVRNNGCFFRNMLQPWKRFQAAVARNNAMSLSFTLPWILFRSCFNGSIREKVDQSQIPKQFVCSIFRCLSPTVSGVCSVVGDIGGDIDSLLQRTP